MYIYRILTIPWMDTDSMSDTLNDLIRELDQDQKNKSVTYWRVVSQSEDDGALTVIVEGEVS